MFTRKALSTAAALAASLAISAAQNPSPRPMQLKVGDPAPPLLVGKWVKGEPVKELKKGQVYVVEFWATWCGPCKVTIPHLTELQKKYGEKVRFIGVSIWESDQKDVEPFVKEMGEKMGYTVAMDKLIQPDSDQSEGEMAIRWMQAAGQNGIPSAFIVDREGKIAWIGHPSEMDEPLERVVAGTFDPATHAKTKQDSQDKQIDIMQRFDKAVVAENWDDALKIADEATAAEMVPLDKMMRFKALAEKREFNQAEEILEEFLESDQLKPIGLNMKWELLTKHKKDFKTAEEFVEELLQDEQLHPLGASWKWELLLNYQKDYDRAYKFGRELMEGIFSEDATALNNLAWSIVDPKAKVETKDLALAMEAAEKSLALDRQYYNVDTLARVYWLKGDKAKAIELQKEAVELAPAQVKAEMQATLEEYQKG